MKATGIACVALFLSNTFVTDSDITNLEILSKTPFFCDESDSHFATGYLIERL